MGYSPVQFVVLVVACNLVWSAPEPRPQNGYTKIPISFPPTIREIRAIFPKPTYTTSGTTDINPPTSGTTDINPPTSATTDINPPTSDSTYTHPPTSDSTYTHPPTSETTHTHPPTSETTYTHPPTSPTTHYYTAPTTTTATTQIPPQSCKATAVIQNDQVNGVIWFTQETVYGPVQVSGDISGLTTGDHGFHIHELGDVSGGCITTGGHYNPHKNTHGSPNDTNRHVGDLGNIYADQDGKATITILDEEISLLGDNSIIGRAVVVHAGKDDLGRGEENKEGSLKTGNAGGRVGCAVIGRA